MIGIVLGAIFIIAALSFLSYLYCWNDIQGGRPHIISLRQITNIMDRNVLDLLFGPHEPGYYYALSTEKLAIFRRAWGKYFYREITADGLCMLGAYRYMTGAAPGEWMGVFILLAALCQGINVYYSLRLVRQWAHQIREELDDWRE